MSKPSFYEGVAVAFIASIAIAALVYVINRVFSSTAPLQLLITAGSFAYIAYLLMRSREKLGRLSVLAVWTTLSIASWIFAPSIVVYALLQLGMVWLIRCLYYYNSTLIALADMGLTGLSVAISLWAWFNTHNLFLCLWCFFLTQALFVLLPPDIGHLSGKRIDKVKPEHNEHCFEYAHQAAEYAVRKLTRP